MLLHLHHSIQSILCKLEHTAGWTDARVGRQQQRGGRDLEAKSIVLRAWEQWSECLSSRRVVNDRNQVTESRIGGRPTGQGQRPKD